MGSQASDAGGGRGTYDSLDGDLPVTLRLAGPLARTKRSSLPPGLDSVGASGGRGIYRGVDGDLPVAVRTGGSRDVRVTGRLADTGIMHVNIQGLRSHLAELSAVIRLSATLPDIVCVNETFLDDGIEEIQPEAFEVVGRRDRSYNGDTRNCGGVIVFARAAIADHVTLLETSLVLIPNAHGQWSLRIMRVVQASGPRIGSVFEVVQYRQFRLVNLYMQ